MLIADILLYVMFTNEVLSKIFDKKILNWSIYLYFAKQKPKYD